MSASPLHARAPPRRLRLRLRLRLRRLRRLRSRPRLGRLGLRLRIPLWREQQTKADGAALRPPSPERVAEEGTRAPAVSQVEGERELVGQSRPRGVRWEGQRQPAGAGDVLVIGVARELLRIHLEAHLLPPTE